MSSSLKPGIDAVGFAAEEALQRGLEEKSAEFVQNGGELYRNV